MPAKLDITHNPKTLVIQESTDVVFTATVSTTGKVVNGLPVYLGTNSGQLMQGPPNGETGTVFKYWTPDLAAANDSLVYWQVYGPPEYQSSQGWIAASFPNPTVSWHSNDGRIYGTGWVGNEVKLTVDPLEVPGVQEGGGQGPFVGDISKGIKVHFDFINPGQHYTVHVTNYNYPQQTKTANIYG